MIAKGIILATIILAGCATSFQTMDDVAESYRFPVRIENNVFNRVSLYVLNGGVRIRIGECNGLRRCTLWANEQLTKNILGEGMIYLGWRWSNGAPGIQFFGSIPVWADMVAVLELNKINWFLYPGVHVYQKRADE